MSVKPSAVADEGAVVVAASPQVDERWATAANAIGWVAIVLQWSAALVIILDMALGEVVDWIAQICCITTLVMLLLRAAPVNLESVAMLLIALAGIALHIATAAGGSGLGVFALIVYVLMLLGSVALIVVTVMYQRLWKRASWTIESCILRLPPYFSGLEALNTFVAKHKGLSTAALAALTVLFAIVLLFLLATAVLFFLTEDLCAVGTYDASLVAPANAYAAGRVPPMEAGTADNMDMGDLDLDFTGIWWIRWYEEPIPLYSRLHLEELVSLAGFYLRPGNDTNLTYPIPASSQTGRAHRWGFSNSIAGRIAMMVAGEKNPDSPLNLDLLSDENMFIYGGGNTPWSMRKINDDEWLRRIERQGAKDWKYTFTRIVFADGTPHPTYFDDFVRHMEGTKLRVFTTSSKPCRDCGTYLGGSCSKCSDVCAAA